MTKAKSLEEAFLNLQEETVQVAIRAEAAGGLVADGVSLKLLDLASKGDWLPAARALLLVGLEEAIRDGRGGLGSSRLRRRIEALGK